LLLANLCLESFGEVNVRLQSLWLYWTACAHAKQQNGQAEALALAQRALQTFAWDESSKEKSNLTRLVAECGGQLSSPRSRRPSIVPAIGLSSLKKSSTRRPMSRKLSSNTDDSGSSTTLTTTEEDTPKSGKIKRKQKKVLSA